MAPLDSYFYLNLASAVLILASAAVPVLLSAQLSSRLRRLVLFLGAFIAVHGSYHVAVVLGYDFVGEAILDPISVVVLIFFGLYYLGLIRGYESSKRVGGASA